MLPAFRRTSLLVMSPWIMANPFYGIGYSMRRASGRPASIKRSDVSAGQRRAKICQVSGDPTACGRPERQRLGLLRDVDVELDAAVLGSPVCRRVVRDGLRRSRPLDEHLSRVDAAPRGHVADPFCAPER